MMRSGHRPLGMNARNAAIARLNGRRAIVEARDKLVTKDRLRSHGLPAVPTLATLATPGEVRRFDPRGLGPGIVVKPSKGSQGRGVMVWSEFVDPRTFRRHARDIVDGRFGDDDVVLVEPLLRPAAGLADLSPIGLPDVRIVCVDGRPRMAMLRVPTLASGGAGNLHRGGVGAAVDLGTGRVSRAVLGPIGIDRHPDTGARLLGLAIPCWEEVLDIATRCPAATDLGYLGVDVVVADDLGPVVLEVNSHPGLEIQNVNLRSLLVDR